MVKDPDNPVDSNRITPAPNHSLCRPTAPPVAFKRPDLTRPQIATMSISITLYPRRVVVDYERIIDEHVVNASKHRRNVLEHLCSRLVTVQIIDERQL